MRRAFGVGWIMLLLASWLMLFGITASPAAADNCAVLIENIKDLTDESKVQDCLRTGNNWGRVIGVVVGAAGVTVAGIGLVKPNRPPIRPKPDPPRGAPPKGPCSQMYIEAAKMHSLFMQRKALEQKTVEEFKVLAEGARGLTDIYAQLKEIEWQIAGAKTWATAVNIGSVGGVALSLAGIVQGFLGAAGVITELSVMCPRLVPMLQWMAPAEIKGLAAAFGVMTKTLTTWAAGVGTQWGGEHLKYIQGLAPMSDTFAVNMRDDLVRQVTPYVMKYRKAARTYNLSFAQWGANAQQDLDAMTNAMKEQADRYRAAAQSCPGEHSFTDSFVDDSKIALLIPQIPSELGSIWWMGSGTSGNVGNFIAEHGSDFF